MDMTALLGKGYYVVCADTKSAGEQLAACIEETYPEYRVQIHPAFSLYRKIGPFRAKNKKSCWNILMGNETIKKQGGAFLQKQVKVLSAEPYIDRWPLACSTLQRLRASLLYEVLSGKDRFLFCEDRFEMPETFYFEIWQWLFGLKEWDGSVIWITDRMPDAVTEMLFRDAPQLAQDGAVHLFSYQNGQLEEETQRLVAVCRDAKALCKQLEAAKQDGNHEAVYRYGLSILSHAGSDDAMRSLACCSLAELYEYGRYVKRSFKTAGEWYRKAWEYGDGGKRAQTFYKYYQTYIEEGYEEEFLLVRQQYRAGFADMTEEQVDSMAMAHIQNVRSMSADRDQLRKFLGRI